MTNWKYCVSRNIEPNIAKKISVMPELAAVKRGFLKKLTSSIGCSTRDSHKANSAEHDRRERERAEDLRSTSSRPAAPR